MKSEEIDMDRFSLKPEIVFGDHAVDVLNELKDEKVLIIADPFIVSSGMISLVTNHLRQCTVSIFSDIIPDPPMEKIAEGIVEMNRFKPSVMIACGGGSAIDSAKGIYYYGKIPVKKFIAIPTTSGTGSEVTKFAVFTNSSTGQKLPVVSDLMLPDMAILDVDFVKSVPSKVTADTGLDVLTHAIEAYVSKDANAFTDALAQKAVWLVFKYLERSYTSGTDLEARAKMHEASTLAGIAFNQASLGLNHAMAHNLGGRLKISHGRMNAMLLCHVIWFNADIENFGQKSFSKAALKYASLAKICDVSAATERGMVKGLVEKIRGLMRSLDMPFSLKQAGIPESLIKEVEEDAVKGTMSDTCLKTNPRNVDEKQGRELIKKIKHGTAGMPL